MLLRIAFSLVIALGISCMGGVAWLALRTQPLPVAAPAEPPPFRSLVLATAHTVRPGSLLRSDDLVGIEFPPNDIPRGARRDTPAARGEVIGALVRHTIGAGQVVLPEDIVRPGDHGFLAAVLAPGMRAVSIGVDAVSGTAGLIWPGDQVDIILTQTLDDDKAWRGHRISGETVLHDIRVIAIDQDLTQGATPGSAPGSRNGQVRDSRTVTLEVTPADAERVAVAGRLGRLSLAVVAADVSPLQASTDADATGQASPPAPATTWGSDVSPALGADNGRRATLRVFLGKDEGKDFHF